MAKPSSVFPCNAWCKFGTCPSRQARNSAFSELIRHLDSSAGRRGKGRGGRSRLTAGDRFHKFALLTMAMGLQGIFADSVVFQSASRGGSWPPYCWIATGQPGREMSSACTQQESFASANEAQMWKKGRGWRLRSDATTEFVVADNFHQRVLKAALKSACNHIRFLGRFRCRWR